MQVFRTITDLRRSLAGSRQGTAIGFVPTMGFFHEGHLSLIRRASTGNDLVVASIFVNPLQFGPTEDFEAYPRDLERDEDLARQAGVTHLFVPEAAEMYPSGRPSTRIEVGRIGEVGEGRFRPGHFSGVATICVKLFGIVQPDRAYFGEKDAQQLAVIRQVVRDLNLPVEIVACPTVRGPGGLALSSRNGYLSPRELDKAAHLYRALFVAARLAEEGERSAGVLAAKAKAVLKEEPDVRLQYLEVVDGNTFDPVDMAGEGSVITMAAYVGSVRLIDSVKLTPG